MSKDTKVDQSDLEDMVDKHGLSVVMSLLMNICFDKAEHVRTTWQDDNEAMSWERDGNMIDGWYGQLEH